MNDVSKPAAAADLDEFLGAPATRPWRRRALYAVAAVGILLLLILWWRGSGTAEAGYATRPVTRGALEVTVSATGNLQPTNQVEVGSEQSGLVEQVFVDFNDRVTRGQPLARLDTSRLEDTIVQNRAALAAAQAQVAQAEASRAQADANLARLEEVNRISGGRVPSAAELDTGRAEARRAAAGVRAAEASVAQARAQLSSAETNLAKATIYSPVTGVVLSRQVDPGQTVAASFQAPVLFTIAEDLAQMQLEVRVDEADVGQVREGQNATFTVDAFPGRSFPARITRVDVGANAGAAASSAATANTVVAYTAVLSVDNPDLILRPGMTATADIVTTERQNVLLVPNAALRFSPDQDAQAGARPGGVTGVLVPQRGRGGRGGATREVGIGRGSVQTVHVLGTDGEPRAIRVRVGETDGMMTEVASEELRPGMEVITGRLAPGQPTRSGGEAGAAEGNPGANGEGRPPRRQNAPAGGGDGG